MAGRTLALLMNMLMDSSVAGPSLPLPSGTWAHHGYRDSLTSGHNATSVILYVREKKTAYCIWPSQLNGLRDDLMLLCKIMRVFVFCRWSCNEILIYRLCFGMNDFGFLCIRLYHKWLYKVSYSVSLKITRFYYWMHSTALWIQFSRPVKEHHVRESIMLNVSSPNSCVNCIYQIIMVQCI